jgi:hypothetical protein
MENRFSGLVKSKKNEELLTMVYGFDAWDAQMLEAVQEELKRRNALPADILIRKQALIAKERIELSQGQPASTGGQVLGWLTIFGLFGFLIGYNYAYAKKKSKYTGEKFYKFDKASRDNGRYILYASFGMLILFILYSIVTLDGNDI